VVRLVDSDDIAVTNVPVVGIAGNRPRTDEKRRAKKESIASVIIRCGVLDQ